MTDTLSARTRHSRLFTEGSISRDLSRFAVPILCTNVLQSCNGSVNSMWIGHYLGEAALAAASNAHLVIFLLTATALGLTMAATIMVGQSVGAGDFAAAKRVTGTSATCFAGFSLALAIAGSMLSEPLLLLLGTPSDSLWMAVTYLKILFLALPSVFLYVFITSLLRGVGDSKTPFYFMMLTVAIDVALNPLFILGVGPVKGAGIAGSAFAMFVANTVSLIALVIYLYRRRHPLCIHKSELTLLHVDMSILMALVRKGIPMGAEALVLALGGMLMIVLVNRFGVDTTAAFAVSIQLWMYIQMPALSICMAVGTMAALNAGGQQWDRVRSVARVGVVYSMALTALMVLALYALETNLYRIFLPAESPALFIASHINKIVAWAFVLLGISAVLLSVVRAAGAVTVPFFLYTLELLVVRFPLAATMLDRWQADAIWWSFPVSLAFTLILATLYYKYGRWEAATRSTSRAQILG